VLHAGSLLVTTLSSALDLEPAAYPRAVRVPDQQAVEIWRADQAEPERIEPATELDAGMQFPGLVIDLAEVWAA